MRSVVEQFWMRIERDESGCWLWTGRRSAAGYGIFYVEQDRWGAHRFAYALLVEPIPDGLVIDHLCRVPSCVNPAHLEPVTHGENVLRGNGPTAENARKTHCPHGHPLDGRRASGYRYCKACARKRARRGKQLLTPAERSERARIGALVRWGKS